MFGIIDRHTSYLSYHRTLALLVKDNEKKKSWFTLDHCPILVYRLHAIFILFYLHLLFFKPLLVLILPFFLMFPIHCHKINYFDNHYATYKKSLLFWISSLSFIIAGHTDCVRDIAVLDSNQFLSCSNDGTIRRWHLSGECIHVYNGHNSFVYSLALLPNDNGFVTTGEDKTLRIWQNTSCVQTVHHPCNSVWSVCVLHNGDIITGGRSVILSFILWGFIFCYYLNSLLYS